MNSHNIKKLNAQIKKLSIEVSKNLFSLMHDYPDSWMCRSTELSFSDPIWKKYVYFHLHNGHRSNQKYSNVGVDNEKHEKSLKVKHKYMRIANYIKIRKRDNYIKQESELKYIIYFFLNFISEVSAVLVDRIIKVLKFQKISNSSFEIALYSNYPANWVGPEKTQYRFLGSLNNDDDIKNRLLHIISPIHKNDTRLGSCFDYTKAIMKFINKDNVAFLQTHTSLIDIFNCYVLLFNLFESELHKEIIKYLKIDFGKSLSDKRFKYIDRPKQLSLYNSMVRYLKTNPNIKTILVPGFELVEGRAIIKAARDNGVKVIGVQHGVQGEFGCWRVINATASLSTANSSVSPNQVLVEGSIYAKCFKDNGFKNVKVIGASRIKQLPPRPIKYHKGNNIIIFVMLDLHDWKSLYEWSFNLARTNKNIITINRPHPKAFRKVKDYKKKNMHNLDNFVFDNNVSLNNSVRINKPNFVVARSTGGLIEMALSRWPCILYYKKGEFDTNPIALMKGSNDIITVTDEKKSIENMLRLMCTKDVTDYADILFRIASQHVGAYGHEANYLFKEAILSN